MSILSVSLIVSFTAVVATTAASAQETRITNFRYDKTISIESNYAKFEKTARSACTYISSLHRFKARKECRDDLMNQAIVATKQLPMIVYHNQMIGEDRRSTALTKR
ncbi:hypothetical protein [Sphingorhabdus sp. Alg231-15]|uniref:hypothetical protein n=1 Tax=Sphingorhabdus sp. Alg231-15 TaxID=1922222 RepID=UPI000D553F67